MLSRGNAGPVGPLRPSQRVIATDGIVRLNREPLSPSKNSTSKRLLLFTAKLGYQTRCFEYAARKLGVQLVYVTDRCHQLEDPWRDQAIAVHFETPQVAAYTVMEALRAQNVSGILALGDRPAAAPPYAAPGLGVPYNHPPPWHASRLNI